MMLKNYLTLAFRNLWRNKTFSFINVVGLSIGMAVCISILLFVRFEKVLTTFIQKHISFGRSAKSGRHGFITKSSFVDVSYGAHIKG